MLPAAAHTVIEIDGPLSDHHSPLTSPSDNLSQSSCDIPTSDSANLQSLSQSSPSTEPSSPFDEQSLSAGADTSADADTSAHYEQQLPADVTVPNVVAVHHSSSADERTSDDENISASSRSSSSELQLSEGYSAVDEETSPDENSLADGQFSPKGQSLTDEQSSVDEHSSEDEHSLSSGEYSLSTDEPNVSVDVQLSPRRNLSPIKDVPKSSSSSINAAEESRLSATESNSSIDVEERSQPESSTLVASSDLPLSHPTYDQMHPSLPNLIDLEPAPTEPASAALNTSDHEVLAMLDEWVSKDVVPASEVELVLPFNSAEDVPLIDIDAPTVAASSDLSSTDQQESPLDQQNFLQPPPCSDQSLSADEQSSTAQLPGEQSSTTQPPSQESAVEVYSDQPVLLAQPLMADELVSSSEEDSSLASGNVIDHSIPSEPATTPPMGVSHEEVAMASDSSVTSPVINDANEELLKQLTDQSEGLSIMTEVISSQDPSPIMEKSTQSLDERSLSPLPMNENEIAAPSSVHSNEPTLNSPSVSSVDVNVPSSHSSVEDFKSNTELLRSPPASPSRTLPETTTIDDSTFSTLPVPHQHATLGAEADPNSLSSSDDELANYPLDSGSKYTLTHVSLDLSDDNEYEAATLLARRPGQLPMTAARPSPGPTYVRIFDDSTTSTLKVPETNGSDDNADSNDSSTATNGDTLC